MTLLCWVLSSLVRTRVVPDPEFSGRCAGLLGGDYLGEQA